MNLKNKNEWLDTAWNPKNILYEHNTGVNLFVD